MQSTKGRLSRWAFFYVHLAGALSLMGACGDDGNAGNSPVPAEGSGANGSAAPVEPASSPADGAADAPVEAGSPDASTPVLDGDREVTSTELTGTVAVPPECSLPVDCVPLETSVFSAPVCCREETPCGYVLSTTQQTLLDIPDAQDFAETIWDDGCIPQSFVFSSQPGIDSYRVPVWEGEGGEEILITEDCEYRNFWAFPMPGCCTRDNVCGISTNEIYPTFDALLEGGSAPFAEQECVTAADLNQQLRDSVTLASLAFIPDTTGTCDYAALDQELE